MDDVSTFSVNCENRLMKEGINFAEELVKVRKEVTEFNIISKLRENVQTEREVGNTKALDRSLLTLGCACCLSEIRSENFEGISILETLSEKNTSLMDSCLFWIGIGRYHVGEFQNARLCCEKLLLRSPEHELANKLLQLNRNTVLHDGFSGLIVLAAVIVGAAITGTVLRRF